MVHVKNHWLFGRKQKIKEEGQRYLIVGLISVGQTEIEVLDVEVQVGQDELVLDHLPDDPKHAHGRLLAQPQGLTMSLALA